MVNNLLAKLVNYKTSLVVFRYIPPMKQLFFSSNQGKRFTLWVLESATEQNNNSLTIEDVDFIEARIWPNRTLKLQ
jgi:hypothetical protein